MKLEDNTEKTLTFGAHSQSVWLISLHDSFVGTIGWEPKR